MIMIIFVSCFISLLERHIKPSVQLETAKRKPRFREERKNEEIISRNCQPHHQKASSFLNMHEAVRSHYLSIFLRYSRMSKTVQHAGTARHSTTGEIFVMRAGPVTPRWRFKAGGRTICCEIRKLINSFWNMEELPEEWKESIIVPICKKGNKTGCSDYTGISLLPTTYKILSNILLSKLRKSLGICTQQVKY
jgi:hypothetical protein